MHINDAQTILYDSQIGASPLMIASQSGHTKVVRTLTVTDADINSLTEVSNIPFITFLRTDSSILCL